MRHKPLDDWQETLEKAKEQYQQYLDVSGLYELPSVQKDPEIIYQSPTPEYPLTDNKITLRGNLT